MNILVNTSNLKLGGGVQVADSVVCQLNRFPQHHFIVVLSDYLKTTGLRISDYPNVETVNYSVKNSVSTLLLGRDSFLDDIVNTKNIDCVLTIFGPSRWNPKCHHVSGFAMPHLALPDSPYFKLLHGIPKFKSTLRLRIVEWAFKRSTKYFYTENNYISNILKRKWPNHHVETISNFYNQIFDDPNKWDKVNLPSFEWTSMLTISANYPHKNLSIAVDVAKNLRIKHPDFKFRFIITVDEDQIVIPQELSGYFLLIGKVDITECPSLYRQADITFLPTLLECFSVTYPESMRMGVPIVTTDMEFARGLCGNAALYYSPLNAEDAAEQIYKLSTYHALRNTLIENGKKKLLDFDNYEMRASKLIAYCEKITNKNS